MSGSIGVVANDTGRYTLFSVALLNLLHPPNTRIDWGLSTDISLARNALVKRALEVGSEWIIFLDDDHTFQPDLLIRLLRHDVPIVSPLYMQRAQPFAPIAYSHREGTNNYMPLILPGLPDEGLHEVHAVGTSGMLIRSEVFRAVEYPWFEHGRVGEWNASEDIIFCEKAREAGFPIYVDLAARLGHMSPSAIWPSWVDGEWVVGFSVADGLHLYCPIEKPAETVSA